MTSRLSSHSAGGAAIRAASVFVSHGAPTMPLEQTPTRHFLEGLGSALPVPSAVIAVSAHWCTEQPVVSTAARPETIYDFWGFPEELYRMVYPAPGAPDLAREIADRLGQAGLPTLTDPDYGLDHGAWVPMRLMYPEAEIPVLQLSVQPRLGADHAYQVGQALKPLRDAGVMVLASGAMTHNLREWMTRRASFDAPTEAWAGSFAEWFKDAFARGDTAALLDWARQAPEARRNHPTPEHLLPLFTAMGAGDQAVRIHDAMEYGVLSLDAYRFS